MRRFRTSSSSCLKVHNVARVRATVSPYAYIGGCLRPLGAIVPIADVRSARILQQLRTDRDLFSRLADEPSHSARAVRTRGAFATEMPPMLFKLFRKKSDSRPRFEQDESISEALQRRVSAIEFQPSRGFLKDRRQPKRSVSCWTAEPSLRRHAYRDRRTRTNRFIGIW